MQQSHELVGLSCELELYSTAWELLAHHSAVVKVPGVGGETTKSGVIYAGRPGHALQQGVVE